MNSILTGNNQTRPSMIILPLDIGGQSYGDVVLTQDYVLESEITYGKCRSKDLKEIGRVELKEDRIEVIPYSHCLPERKLFRGKKPQPEEVPFSFYLNYYYEHRHFSHGQRQPEPVYTLQPGLYLKGLFTTAYKDKEGIRDYRLSHDFPEKDIDLSAGFVFSRGFSTVDGYYRKGITLSRKPMSGEPLTGKSHRIVLPTQSEVEVYGNGILVQKLTLPAGIYHFENLPVSGLTNELTIRIRDSLGRVREEKLSLLYSPIVRFLLPEEAQRLLEASPEHLKRIILFALNTGCRAGEILKLRWEQVDFKAGVIHIEAVHTKSKKKYTILMNSEVKALLESILKEQGENGIKHGFVFTNSLGLPYSRQGYKRAFKTALAKAGIKDFRFHDLRHTFASWIAMETKDIYLVQRLLNHQSVETTKRYAHLTQDYIQNSLEKITAVLRKKKKRQCGKCLISQGF